MIVTWWACASTEPAGRWFHAPDSFAEEDRATVEQLMALGYADGTLPGSDQTGVVVHRPQAVPGLAFYASGHGSEAVLMDLDGTELHRWHHDFWATWPDAPVSRDHGGTHNFRRARLLPDGHILAIHEGLGIVRLGPDDVVVWASLNGAHHDVDVLPDGQLALLVRRPEERAGFDEPVLVDRVSFLDAATGTLHRQIDLLAAVASEPWLAAARRRNPGDPLHSNSVSVLRAAMPAIDGRAGDVLVSLRTPSRLVLVDGATGALRWTNTGPFLLQHDARPDGPDAVLLFDNEGAPDGARALRLSLPDLAILWSWGADVNLRSRQLGAVNALPDGHRLVTESEGGRAFEVDVDGTVVWQFHNPHRAGDQGQWVAALFEVERHALGGTPPWVDGRPTPARPAGPGGGCR